MVNKAAIRRNFSKYAKAYDDYAFVQKVCAGKLLDKIGACSVRKIFEVGCGTGNYSAVLRKKFPQAQITAVDISEEMVEVARSKFKDDAIEFSAADGETLNLKGRFNLITSNVSFQWFSNLQKALLRFRSVLEPQGVILFSIFGPLTFYELGRSLKEAIGPEFNINAQGFHPKSVINGLANKFFRNVEIEEFVYKERYESLWELLRTIKYTGSGGTGLGAKYYWSQKAVSNIEKVYKKRFNEDESVFSEGNVSSTRSLAATYQVFFCKMSL